MKGSLENALCKRSRSFQRMLEDKTGNTNLWHQRTPHQSCQQILVRCSADTSERCCAFVMSLWVRKKEYQRLNVFSLQCKNERHGYGINLERQRETVTHALFKNISKSTGKNMNSQQGIQAVFLWPPDTRAKLKIYWKGFRGQHLLSGSQM